MLTTPGHGGVIREEIIRRDPGHGGQVIRICRAQVRGAATDTVSHIAEVATDQVFRRGAGLPLRNVGIAAAQVGEVVRGAQLKGQRWISRHETRQRRQQQRLQH